MNKYLKLIESLSETGEGYMTCFGNSMTPILNSGSTLHFKKFDDYEVDDIVFCRVNGRYIDAHLIIKKSNKGFLIANNHGHENGWTKTIYGKVIGVNNE